MPKTTTLATRLNSGLMRNITKVQPSMPTKGTRRGTLKVGRKLTVSNVCSINTTTFNIPYVMRKNMVMMPATASRPPLARAANNARSPTPPAKNIAWRGSPSSDSWAKRSLKGMISYMANACITRGAATSDPRADEKVAPSIPAKIVQPYRALSTMIVLFASSSSGVAMRDNQ